MASKQSEHQIVQEAWQRYEYARDRGHSTFCEAVSRLEDYYLGGGDQWSEDDKALLDSEGRPHLEFNEVMPAVNSAVGYQIANRADISFKPRAGLANQEIANVLSKVAMQIADNTQLHWLETDVFTDGMIQRRGWWNVRLNFDDSMKGEVGLEQLDPMDVLPDPDAKNYDPDQWGDVIITRWLTYDEVEQRYGKSARKKAEQFAGTGLNPGAEEDFGEREGEERRNSFGDEQTQAWDAYTGEKSLRRVRVIDRQKFIYATTKVMITGDSGDVRPCDDWTPERIANETEKGGLLTRKMMKRVRWTVTTYDALLHDDWSPFPFLSTVLFAPYFRRGKTRGMVDNAMGPQDALNKAVSQFIHIITTTANSGWQVEEDSLSNMDTDDLEAEGSKSGLVLEFKKGTTPPAKIPPGQLPAGVDRIIDRLTRTLKDNTVPDAMRGLESDDTSGLMLQSRQYAAQQALALPLSNLARSRHLLARRILWVIQNYYDDERIFRITRTNVRTGKPEDEEIRINVYDPATKTILNDLTIGEYDVVITEQPQQVTFENGQFEQVMKMREAGIAIKDYHVVRASNLADKTDILEDMASQGEKPDPLTEADIALKAAQTRKADAEATSKKIETQFSAIQTAQVIATLPQTAPLADALLRSGGYQDEDAAPIVPQLPAPMQDVPLPPANTNPLTPTNPDSPAVGLNQGIETPVADSIT